MKLITLISPFGNENEEIESIGNNTIEDFDMIAVKLGQENINVLTTQDENGSTIEKDKLSEGTFEPIPLLENESKVDLEIVGTSNGLFFNKKDNRDRMVIVEEDE